MDEIVMAIVTLKDKVLIVRRAKKEGNLRWQFPGGTVDQGETLEEATIRELKEETGVNAKINKVLGNRIHPYTKKHITYFSCNFIDGEIQVNDSDLDKAQWVYIKDLGNYFTTSLFEPVEKYLKGLIKDEGVNSLQEDNTF